MADDPAQDVGASPPEELSEEQIAEAREQDKRT
jgi:hypothetical protein